MAYLVSQIRKNPNSTYMQNLQINSTTFFSPNTFGQDTNFEDFALQLSSSNNEVYFDVNKVYYLRFRIHKIPQYYYSARYGADKIATYADADQLRLQIILVNKSWGKERGEEEEFNPELIGSCTVPVGLKENSEEYSSFSFVFSPTQQFDTIVFRVMRTTYDAIYRNDYRKWLTEGIPQNPISVQIASNVYKDITVTGTKINYGATTDDEYGDFCSLVNIVPNQQKWLKFGYQSRPGNLVVVNGQPIIIGRSGIYEIDNGTNIESFMIACPNGADTSKIDPFLLDYAYNGTV